MEEVSADCADNTLEINNVECKNMEENADETEDDNQISKDDRNGDNEGENIDEEVDDGIFYVMQLSGLPGSCGRGFSTKLYRHLTSVLKLEVSKVCSDCFGSSNSHVFFSKEKEYNRAMAMLNGYSYSGNVLKASASNSKVTPSFLRKIGFLNLPRKLWGMSVEDRVQKAVLQLDEKPYEIQLKIKQEVFIRKFRSIETKMRLRNIDLANFTVSKRTNTNIMCDIEPMVESPHKEGYGNKSVFSIGKNSEDDSPKVGFRIGNYEKKEPEIGPYNHLKNLSDSIKSVAKAFERFVAVSKHDPWEPYLGTGVWRSFNVKTSRDGTALLNVHVFLEGLDEAQIEALKEDLINFFTNDEESTVKVTSFYIQRCSNIELNKYDALELIGGHPYIEETILGQNYKVTPNSVHEINTDLLEVLYEKVIDVVMEDSNSMVLNIYCDIGVIASKLIQKGRNVVSFEPRALLAEQARENLGESASLLTEGTVEEALNSIPKGESVTVVVILMKYDKVQVLERIGQCDNVKRVVCISVGLDIDVHILKFLNEEAKAKDLFMPVKVIPFDSEPYTFKYVGVVVFETWAFQDEATTTSNGVEVRKISRQKGSKYKGDLRGELVNRRIPLPARPRVGKFGRPELESRRRGYRDQHFDEPMALNTRDRGGRFHPYSNMDGPNRYGDSWGPSPTRPMYNNPSIPSNYDEGYERGFMMAMQHFMRGRGGPGPGSI